MKTRVFVIWSFPDDKPNQEEEPDSLVFKYVFEIIQIFWTLALTLSRQYNST